jgi:hypothetical protein
MTTERPIRQSIRPTYDSRETGPRFHVTYRIGTRTITFQQPTEDPFVRGTIALGWRDLLRGLVRGRLEVSMIVGGDRDIVDDVMELDENTLVPGRSTRRDAFNSHLGERMAAMVDGQPG